MGESSGLLTTWNDSLFDGETLFHNDVSLSIRFTSEISDDCWILPNIYGPCQGDLRVDYTNWLLNLNIPTTED